MMQKIAALVTLDVHPQEEIVAKIDSALNELEELGIRATFFVTASVARENSKTIRRIIEAGHQVGSHGLYHNSSEFNGYPPERYDNLGEDLQRKFIKEATEILEGIIGNKVTAFRSPCFMITGTTVRLLEEYGYLADVSVNSQRLDLLSSDPFGFKQLLAPRMPYHPSFSNCYKKGDSQIWEIPLSGLIVPFAIMTAKCLRLPLTKLLLYALWQESRINRKPIVYMAHPEEFSASDPSPYIPLRSLKLKDFLPFGGHGIVARYAFRIHDPAKVYQYNKEILRKLKSFKNVEFVTVEDYTKFWLPNKKDRIRKWL